MKQSIFSLILQLRKVKNGDIRNRAIEALIKIAKAIKWKT